MMSGSEPRPVALYSPSRRRTVTSPCASRAAGDGVDAELLQIRGAAYNLGNDVEGRVDGTGAEPGAAHFLFPGLG